MTMEFKTLQLIIDEKRPDVAILRAINESITKNYKSRDTSYVFSTEYDEEKQILWIYAQYENYKIRNNLVYDKRYIFIRKKSKKK